MQGRPTDHRNIVLGIADEISSMGNLERIRFVGDIVDDYNAGAGG